MSTDRDEPAAVLREPACTPVPYQVELFDDETPRGPAAARASARAEGYAVGWAQGMREARAATECARHRATEELGRMLRQREERAERALRALAVATDEVRATSVQRAEEIADFVLSAAIDLAEAVLGAALAADVLAAGRDAVRRALAQLPPAGPVRIRLNPDDHAELTAAGTADLTGSRDVTLIADPRLARGDAVAETAVSTVDATLSAALQRVRAELAR